MNSYDGTNFVVDTDAAISELRVLKGSAISSTDIIWPCEDAEVYADEDFVCKKFDFGDNPTGTAVTKAGHLIYPGGRIITLHDTAAHGGLDGAGSLNTIISEATAGNRSIIQCNTVDKCSIYNLRACALDFRHTTLKGFLGFQLERGQILDGAILDNFYWGLYLLESHDGTILDGSYEGLEISGAFSFAITNNFSSNPIDFSLILSRDNVKLTRTAQGASELDLYPPAVGNYTYLRFATAAILAAPSWTGAAGIQTLTAGNNLELSAAWGAATHGTGDDVLFNIYIRAGEDPPDTFGVDSAYFLAATTATSMKIMNTPDGSALVDGTTYQVIVRCATKLSDEDGNTTALSAEANDSEATIPTPVLPLSGSIETETELTGVIS